MSDAKLMMPLFCNGMFNCGGRRIRAVHLYDVSDGEHRYRLWTKAGTPDIDYPRVESDRYLLLSKDDSGAPHRKHHRGGQHGFCGRHS